MLRRPFYLTLPVILIILATFFSGSIAAAEEKIETPTIRLFQDGSKLIWEPSVSYEFSRAVLTVAGPADYFIELDFGISWS